VYDSGGTTSLDAWVRSQPPQTRQALFVRVVNIFNRITFLRAPDDWYSFREIPTGWEGYRRQVGVIRIPQNAERDFTFVNAVLPDGSLLQVGRTTDSREALLNPLRRKFLIAGTAAVLLGFAGGALFANRALLPVRQIVETAKSIIRTGEMDARVP